MRAKRPEREGPFRTCGPNLTAYVHFDTWIAMRRVCCAADRTPDADDDLLFQAKTGSASAGIDPGR